MKLADLFFYTRIRAGTIEPVWMTQITLALYALTGLLALGQMRRSAKQRYFYGAVAVVLFGVGVARHFRWLEALTMAARMFAIVEGWYTGRHIYQRQLIHLGIAGGVIILLIALWRWRRQLAQQGLVLMGVIYQLTFLLVQAISFHNLDGWLSLRWHGFRYGTLLEWGGLVVVGGGLLLGDWSWVGGQLVRLKVSRATARAKRQREQQS